MTTSIPTLAGTTEGTRTAYLDRSFLPYCQQDIGAEEMAAVLECLQSDWITTGPRVGEFELACAEHVNARHAVALNSCTAALHLALEVLGVKEGDEVITTPMTFCATAEAIEYMRARPVFVDVEPDTLNISPRQMARAITDRTKALLPVHYGGHPCEMGRILALAGDAGLPVVEDAAHAMGAYYRGRPVGSLGDITCFSFYATKNMTTAEGGLLATDNPEWADKARILGLHGISRDAWKRYSSEGSWHYDVMHLGYKYNMTDLAASLGLVQLRRLTEFNDLRRVYARMYDRAFSEVPEVSVLATHPHVVHARHLYVIQLDLSALTIDRAAFIEELKKMNVGTSVHFIPLHLQPYYRNKYGYQPGDFPVAEAAYERMISLPLYPRMSEEDVRYVTWAVKEVIAKYHR